MTDDPEPPRDFTGAWRVLPDLSDPPEIRSKFGYENLVLDRRARQWLEAQGVRDTGNPLDLAGLEYQTRRARERYCVARPTYREISDARRLHYEWVARQEWREGRQARGGLTKPEWEHLAEHFAGANDPLAQSILEKARKALDTA